MLARAFDRATVRGRPRYAAKGARTPSSEPINELSTRSPSELPQDHAQEHDRCFCIAFTRRRYIQPRLLVWLATRVQARDKSRSRNEDLFVRINLFDLSRQLGQIG